MIKSMLEVKQCSGTTYINIVSVTVDGRELSCLVYIDRVVEEGRPKVEYIDRINNGIRDAGLPDEYVSRFLRPFVPE